MREAIAAVVGVVSPLVTGWLLVTFGPRVAFGVTAVDPGVRRAAVSAHARCKGRAAIDGLIAGGAARRIAVRGGRLDRGELRVRVADRAVSLARRKPARLTAARSPSRRWSARSAACCSGGISTAATASGRSGTPSRRSRSWSCCARSRSATRCSP